MPRFYRDWLTSEVKLLTKLYPTTKTNLLMKIFNRPEDSIKSKASHLGVHKNIKEQFNPNWKGGKSSSFIHKRPRHQYKAPFGKETHHIDGDPYNNDPPNIEFLTRREHMIKDGRMNNLKQFKGGMNFFSL